jgi:hypothetical protein
MFGGSQQGGSGSNLVRLTSLFPSKKGNGTFVGSIKPDAFNTLFKLMQEAHSKGVDLMFIASPDKQNQGRAVLYVAPSNKASQGGQAAPGPFGAPAPQQQFQAPVQTQVQPSIAATATPFAMGGAASTQGNISNPPKDEIDSLLESL